MFISADLAGAFAVAVTTVIMVTDKRLIHRLRQRGADSPANAVSLDDMRGLASWRLSRLTGKGMIRRAGEATFFVDEAALRAAGATRRKRLLVLLCLAAAAGAVYLAIVYLVP